MRKTDFGDKFSTTLIFGMSTRLKHTDFGDLLIFMLRNGEFGENCSEISKNMRM